MPGPRTPSTLADWISGAARILGVVAFVGVLQFTGVLAPTDGSAYDVCSRADPPRAPSSLLLVEYPRSDDPPRLPILHSLLDMGASQVVFTEPPQADSQAFFNEASRHPNVLVASPSTVGLPPTQHGITRQQFSTFGSAPALEIEAARLIQPETPTPGPEPYGVRFRGGAGSLPHVVASDLLAGRLVPELVREKIVLVGPASGPTDPGLVTPTTADGRPMSLLEFQGHALETLLSGRPVRVPGWPVTLALLLLSTTAGAMAFRRLSPNAAFVTLTVAVAGLAVTAYLLLTFASVWLPVTALAASLFLVYVLVLQRETASSRWQARALLARLTDRFRDRPAPPTFAQAADPWQLLVNFVRQVLDLERIIILEAVPGSRHLREVAAHGCTPADIFERRRDFTRTPYQTALDANGPLSLTPPTRTFFTAASKEEREYLVPLVFAGRMMGFWALTIDPARVTADDAFTQLLRDYADRMAALLHERREALQDGRHSWARRLRPAAEDHHALAGMVAQLESRLVQGERLFSESSTPTVVFDLFGRLREANAAMQEFLGREQLASADVTAVDLIAALTGDNLVMARRCLRHVVHEEGRLTLSVQPRAGGHYLLQVYPLRARQGDEPGDSPTARVTGVCCELVERTALVKLNRLKELLAQQLGVNLRNDLAAIELSASLLAIDLDQQERAELVEVVHGKVQQVIGKLAEAQRFFSLEHAGEGECLPVDGLTPLEAAVQAVTPLARTQAVTFQVVKPAVMSYVLATPDQLGQLFTTVLTTLVKDSRSSSTVTVRVNETENTIRYAFTNTGFGLPEDRLRQYLFGDEVPVSPELRRLRTGITWVRGWGGTVEAHSRPGEAVTIQMDLPRFI